MAGTIANLPYYKHSYEFVDARRSPYWTRRIEEDPKSNELIRRLERLELSFPERFALWFESYISKAKVVAVRTYSELSQTVVAYETDGVRIAVGYDCKGNVIDFTFLPDDAEPMRFVAEINNERETRREDVVLDSFWEDVNFWSVEIRSENGKSFFLIGIEWDTEYETIVNISVSWYPYGCCEFALDAELSGRKEAEQILLTCLHDGFQAALKSVKGWHWRDAHAWEIRDANTLDFARACQLRLSRYGLPHDNLDRLIEILSPDNWGSEVVSKNITFFCGDHEKSFEMVYHEAMMMLNQGSRLAGGCRLLYLALHGHEKSRIAVRDEFKYEPEYDPCLVRFWAERRMLTEDESPSAAENDDMPF